MQIQNVKNSNRALAWFFLIFAILLEVGGVTSLKVIPMLLDSYSVENNILLFDFTIPIPLIAKAILLIMIGISYYFMSLALRTIALGVAYSTWEIVGLIGILLISFFFFDPQLTTQQYIGIVCGFVGIICVILGEEH